MSQTRENGKKPSFGPDFGPIGPNLGCQFFFKYLALPVTRYHGQPSAGQPSLLSARATII